MTYDLPTYLDVFIIDNWLFTVVTESLLLVLIEVVDDVCGFTLLSEVSLYYSDVFKAYLSIGSFID